MKPINILAAVVVFSLLLVANLSCATKDLGGYWKKIMKGQPMPEAIKGLLINQEYYSDAGKKKKDLFVRDFDIRPNLILYHTHTHVNVVPIKQKQKSYVKINDAMHG